MTIEQYHERVLHDITHVTLVSFIILLCIYGQNPYCAFECHCKRLSFSQISVGGIIMLRDTSESGEPEDLIEPLNGKQSRILDHEFSITNSPNCGLL